MTIELWANLTGPGGGSMMGNMSGTTDAVGFKLGTTGSRQVTFGFGGGTWAGINDDLTSKEDDQGLECMIENSWHHIAVTKHLNVYRLFIDGIQHDSYSEATAFATTNDLCFGRARTGDSSQFHGWLDDVAIYIGSCKYLPLVTGQGTATITPTTLPIPSGNHFATHGLDVNDQLLDTPENNFATLNPLNTSKQMSGTNYHGGTLTFSEGALKS